MTSSKHPTAQQSICATSKTDLIYWDTPHGQHGQPGQHEPSTRYPRPNEPDSLSDEKQHHWFETLRFRVQKPGRQCPLYESLRQAVSLWNTVSIPWPLHQLQTLVSDRKHIGNRRKIRSIGHRDHCTTKPQTFSRVSLPRWKGVWAQAR